MKFTYVILAFALTVFLTGCNKDDNDPSGNGNYFMKFTINGVTKEYKGNTLAEFTDPGYEVSMVALQDASESENSMSIVLHSSSPFNTNITYTEANDATGYPGASLIYFDELSSVYTSLNTTLAPDAEVSVTFTDITDTYVKGTFSGKLYEDAFSTVTYTVTNGSFYLKKD